MAAILTSLAVWKELRVVPSMGRQLMMANQSQLIRLLQLLMAVAVYPRAEAAPTVHSVAATLLAVVQSSHQQLVVSTEKQLPMMPR